MLVDRAAEAVVAVDLADGWCRRWLPGLRRLDVERATRLHIARKISICSVFADGETRTRTGDTTIFSRVLYQLSYLAVVIGGSG